jgi:hypothetical protein
MFDQDIDQTEQQDLSIIRIISTMIIFNNAAQDPVNNEKIL